MAQVFIAAWLSLTMVTALLAALRRPKGSVLITATRQRQLALTVLASAAGEALTLWWGGFFQ